MTFSLSKCPYKRRTKTSSRKRNGDIATLSQICEERSTKPRLSESSTASFDVEALLENSPSRIRRRKRSEVNYDIPIPSFVARNKEIDLSVLESSPERPSMSKRSGKLDPFDGPEFSKTHTNHPSVGNSEDSDSDNDFQNHDVLSKLPLLPQLHTNDNQVSDLSEVNGRQMVETNMNINTEQEKTTFSELSTSDLDVCKDGIIKGSMDPEKGNERANVLSSEISPIDPCIASTKGMTMNQVNEHDIVDIPEPKPSCNHENAKYENVSPKKTKTLVSTKQLLQSVDSLYILADIERVTVKDIIRSLESEFHTTLDRKLRKEVKNRLKSLISGQSNPAEKESCSCLHADEKLSQATNRLKNENKLQKIENSLHAYDPKNDIHHEVKTNGLDSSSMTSSKSLLNTSKVEINTSEIASTYDPSEPMVLHDTTNNFVEVNIPDAGRNKGLEKLEQGPESLLNRDLEIRNEVDALHSSVDIDFQEQKTSKPFKPKTKRAAKQKSASIVKHTQIVNSCLSSSQTPVNQLRKQKNNCPLCTTCFCQNKIQITKTKTREHPTFAKTYIDIERALIKRQKRLEKVIQKNENDLELVNKELKKHRRTLARQKSAAATDNSICGTRFCGSRFLPDVDIWESHLQIDRGSLSPEKVIKARAKLFGKLSASQPTLTQMNGVVRIEEENIEEKVKRGVPIIPKNSSAMEFKDPPCDDVLEEPSEPVVRIIIRDGVIEKEGEGSTLMWPSVPSNYESKSDISNFPGWDSLFLAADNSSSGKSFDDLLELFEKECKAILPPPASTTQCSSQFFVESEGISLSQLSQTAQEVAIAMETQISAMPDRLAHIEFSCPNWKENIRFALNQRETVELTHAIENVHESKRKLQEMGTAISGAWQRQQSILHLYEVALSISLSRAQGKSISYEFLFDEPILADMKPETFEPLNRISEL